MYSSDCFNRMSAENFRVTKWQGHGNRLNNFDKFKSSFCRTLLFVLSAMRIAKSAKIIQIALLGCCALGIEYLFAVCFFTLYICVLFCLQTQKQPHIPCYVSRIISKEFEFPDSISVVLRNFAFQMSYIVCADVLTWRIAIVQRFPESLATSNLQRDVVINWIQVLKLHVFVWITKKNMSWNWNLTKFAFTSLMLFWKARCTCCSSVKYSTISINYSFDIWEYWHGLMSFASK